MSKKSVQCKYLEAASLEAIDAICAKIDETKKAKRKPKKLKIEPIIPTVVRCIGMGKSSRKIVDIVSKAHGVDISKDAILRFRKIVFLSVENKLTC